MWYIYIIKYCPAIKGNEFESVETELDEPRASYRVKSEKAKQILFINAYI